MDLYGSPQACTYLRSSSGVSGRRLPNLSTMKDSYKNYSLTQPLLPGNNNLHLSAKTNGLAFHRSASVGHHRGQEAMPRTKMPPLKPVMAMCSQITSEAWARANSANYRRSETSRRRTESFRMDTCRLIQNKEQFTRRTQSETNKWISDRIMDIAFWSEEMRHETEILIRDTEVLRDVKVRLDSTVADTEGPLQIARECLCQRQKRLGSDLVNDNVEKELEREVAVIRSCQQHLVRVRDKVKKQLEANRKAQAALEKDLNDKHMAHQIDSKCHDLINCSSNNYYPNISRLDQSVSVPATWAQFSENNLLQSQSERVQTQRVREEVDSLLGSTDAAMRCQGNKVNLAFTGRINQITQTKDRLQEHLAKTLQEMFQTERTIAELERAINDKRAPLRVAQSRLEERARRPNMELCKDPPHTRLLSEVQFIQDTVSSLAQRLAEAHDALQELADTKSVLEQELFTKAHSLFIDQERCLGLRKTHTHTRYA